MMFIPGLCSVTLNDESPESVVEITKSSGLKAIEWGGNVHVPHGDEAVATKVQKLTREAGLEMPSYGSYYRVGVSEQSDLSFASVLSSAKILGVSTIRVWAGSKNYQEATPAEINAVILDAQRIAALAASAGISITFEFHGGTLTNSYDTTMLVVEKLKDLSNIFFSWQVPHGFTRSYNLAGLARLLPYLSTVHVYHWTIGSYEKNIYNEQERVLKWPEDYHKHPLEDGLEDWSAYLDLISQSKIHSEIPLLLEFVKGGSVEQLQDDAKTLLSLIENRI